MKQRTLQFRGWSFATALAGLVVFGFGCGSAARTAEATAGSGGLNFTTVGSGGGGSDSSCGKYEQQGELVPASLFVMFDKSSSMAGSKWDSAKAGLNAFATAASSEGLRVALNFFPREPDTTPLCDQQAYATPRVNYGLLPAHAPALMAAIESESPDGIGTPIFPALGGALLGGIAATKTRPNEAAAVLLVTDGVPEGPAALCAGVDPQSPEQIANLASQAAAQSPPVLTFVVGLPGVDQSIANQIAKAGGTESAILVSTKNVEKEFADALTKVRGKVLPCSYAIPDEVNDSDVGISKVNIEVTPTMGEPYTLKQNLNCDGPGWRYDNPTMPTNIELCPDSCAALEKDPTAAIQIVLGCATQVK